MPICICLNNRHNFSSSYHFSNGEIIYVYGSQGNGSPDLYYSDLNPVEYGDSTYIPHFISIMSQIPPNGTANLLLWTAFNNETLMVIDNNGDYVFIENFINHSPHFSHSPLNDTLGIDNNYSYELIASDTDGDTLAFFLENNPEWTGINNGQLFIEPQEDGIFSFNVIVSDGELTDVLECVITVGEYRPTILSILDIPNDDGGWIYIEFLKSFWDTGDTRNTEIYHIERLTSEEWISVGSSAAYNSGSYTVQVTTDQDSTTENNGMTVFRVIASMDEGTWISIPDSGYSINNNSFQLLNDIILPNNFSLLQNYPNPFNSNTIIRYSLPEESRVSIIIYDILGQQVKELINEVQEPGYKSVSWDGKNNLARPTGSGVYLFRMKTNNYNKTKILILSK